MQIVASKKFSEMTDDEIEQAVRKIVASSENKEEIKERLREELDYRDECAINFGMSSWKINFGASRRLVSKNGEKVIVGLVTPRGLFAL